MGCTSAPRRCVAILSNSARRWSRRGREVLPGRQCRSARLRVEEPKLWSQLDFGGCGRKHSRKVWAVPRSVKVDAEQFAIRRCEGGLEVRGRPRWRTIDVRMNSRSSCHRSNSAIRKVDRSINSTVRIRPHRQVLCRQSLHTLQSTSSAIGAG